MYWKPVLITPVASTQAGLAARTIAARAVLVVLSTVKFTAQNR